MNIMSSTGTRCAYVLISWTVCAAFAFAAFTAPAIADDYATAAELKLMQGFPPPPDKRVNMSNALMTPPFNRWAYLHMRTIYPSATINSAAQAIPMRKAMDGGIERLSVQKPEGKGKADIDTYLKETYTDSIVVIHGDKIVFERFLNSMHSHQPHQMMSVTKSFAGLLGLLAVEEGKIKESDLVVNYVPELKKAGGFKDATFGQVLDMTNSMDFTEDYADPESGIRRYSAVLGWTEPLPGVKYEANLYDYLVTLDIDKDHKHGEIFHYQTPKTDVVNWVTNRVDGQSFQSAMHEKLWSKLGTDGETYVLLDKNGTLVAGGGLNATPYNLARFAMMMLNDGIFNGTRVVPASVISKISNGGDIDAFSRGPDSYGFFGTKDWSYRAQWWVRHTPGKEAFMALGIHGQFIYIDHKRNVAIVKQSSQPVSVDDFYDTYNFNAFDAIISYLTK